jgi:hypothetical protein
MDVYSHIIEGMEEDAMNLLDGIMPKGILQKSNDKINDMVDITSDNS